MSKLNKKFSTLSNKSNKKSNFVFGNKQQQLKGRLKKIKSMKKEFDLYDEEGELVCQS